MPLERKIVALTLAADRNAGDAVAKVAGVPSKGLAPLAGIPMIVRVLNALLACGRLDSILLCGPAPAAVDACPPLRELIDQEAVSWFPAEDSLSGSVLAGLARMDPDALALITTADHALLDAGIVDYFLDRVLDGRADVSVGMADYDLVRRAYPGARRTTLKFAEGGYCGCNLFALDGARARDIISLWQRTQTQRKRPWRMVLGLFGFGMLAQYASGRMSMDRVRQAVREATGIALDFICLPFPHAAIDVDTPADLELAQKIFREQLEGTDSRR